MHTMVVRMSIDPARADEAARHLREDVVAWTRQQPGFVNGQWLRSPDGSEGIAVVVFASGDAPASPARAPPGNPRDDRRSSTSITTTTPLRPTPPFTARR